MDKNIDRLSFLAELFDVFVVDEENPITTKTEQLEMGGYKTEIVISDKTDKLIGILSKKNKVNGKPIKKFSLSYEIFSDIINADPTENKQYMQWILNIIFKCLKSDDEKDYLMGLRLIDEDLPQANKYLTIFSQNYKKKRFKTINANTYSLKGLTDVSNINQYKSLSQLFDAVDPFIERDPSSIERNMLRFVEIGQAVIPFRDRKFTVFIPKTRDASTLFNNYANWCTARESNGMFDNYVKNYKNSYGKDSDLIIIINNLFFENKSSELYQIHFESNQLKDKSNGSNVSIYDSVISQSDGIGDFFYQMLLPLAKHYKGDLKTNYYLDFLVKFGFTESLFEVIDEETPIIRIVDMEIPKIPNINKFNCVDQMVIVNSHVSEIHPSIGELSTLELLSLNNNKLKSIPKEIGNLKNLTYLNIKDNPITVIPEELKFLDKVNGGSLEVIALTKNTISTTNYKKILELLPSARIE